jgi:hypothetical protein
VNLFLASCIEQNIFSRIMFIKNNSSSHKKINIFTVNNRDDSPFMKRFVLADYREIMDINLDACFNNEGVDILKEPVYLVCTHGKVDMCCSKFGIPIFKALTELDANTWQATHVTGDRFAPNVVQLPYSHYYGWLDINEMTDFYTIIKNGNIYMEKYRGRACHSKGEQAAEFFLRNTLNEQRSDALRLSNTGILQGTISNTRFCHKPSDHQYDVQYTTEKSVEKYFMSCKSDEAVPVDLFKLTSIIKT